MDEGNIETCEKTCEVSEKILAVLFDFDGVLGDTMEDHLRAWQKAMTDFGITITAEEYYIREGMRLVEVARELWAIANPGSECDAEEIVKRKEKYYLECHSFSFYPGAEALVVALAAQHTPIALVTAARRARLSASVPSSFLNLFNSIVSGEDSGRGKPFPDPYLAAATRLAVPIENCIVVENAPLGIHSAKSAGAYCVAIASTLSKDKLQEANKVVGRIGEIEKLDIFKNLINEGVRTTRASPLPPRGPLRDRTRSEERDRCRDASRK